MNLKKNPNSSPQKKPAVITGMLLAIGIIVVAVHWPALSAKAVAFDDMQYVGNNGLVQNPGWNSARRFFVEIIEPSTVRGYYQPLSMVSLMLDCVMDATLENPTAFHLTSLLLHTVNTVLAAIILYLLFGRLTLAGLLALLWGLHPLMVEPVPWVGERKTLLAAFFSLASLVFYILYAQPDKKHKMLCFMTSLLCYILAILSKPTSMPLPLLMLILDVWFLDHSVKKALLEKIPFFILAVISGIVTIISQGRTAHIEFGHERGVWEIILIICHNIMFYLGKLIWPAKLYPHYPFPETVSLDNPAFIVGLSGTILLAAALLISLQKTRAAVFGFLFFLIAALPTMQVLRFSNVIASDKFMYLPSLGIYLAVGCGLSRLFGRLAAEKRKWPAISLAALLIIAGLAEVGLTRSQYAHWRTSEQLYRHILRYEPRAAGIWSDLGVFYYWQRNIDQALVCWKKALDSGPANAAVLDNLATVLATEKTSPAYDPPKAVEFATLACEMTNYEDATMLDTLATAYAADGQLDKAIETDQKALQQALRSSQLELARKIEQKLQAFRQEHGQ